ncbi:MAG: hypothetical protein HC933_02055 [Pleurocapsa sp. SU_196_0]|nr:hypothetical protein [Pleurocapsa sp. SU_196_0]
MRQLRYGNQTTTYRVSSSGEFWGFLEVNWVFPTPFDGEPAAYGYFQNVAHWLSCGVLLDHQRVCLRGRCCCGR